MLIKGEKADEKDIYVTVGAWLSALSAHLFHKYEH